MKLTPGEIDELVWAEIRKVRAEGLKVAEPDDEALKDRAEWYIEKALKARGAAESEPDAVRLFRQLWPES